MSDRTKKTARRIQSAIYLILFGGVTIIWFVYNDSSKRAACEDLGGTYVEDGRRCLTDGDAR